MKSDLIIRVLALTCIAATSSAFSFAPTTSLSCRHVVESTTTASRLQMMVDPSSLMEASSNLMLAAEEKDMSEFYKSAAIVLVLGGGLIPATIAANIAMFKTMSGKKEKVEEDVSNVKPGETFDPTIFEQKYRKYVSDSGAGGPNLALSTLLFASEPIKVADIVAILGRIKDVNSICDWNNLPSTQMPNVSMSEPPMWLPRKAFKVYIRKAKWLGWPTDPKSGQPVGGAELQAAEEARIKKNDVQISDAALDAVFDSWAWGASIATPDKVANTLRIYKTPDNEVDLGAFVGAALRGRSTTGLAALSFVVIQLAAFVPLFIAPTLKYLFDIDLGILGK